ncbi:glycosyl hydrolase family 28-related protein [Paenibacillus allorhizosphaerae]|uniref:Rhamnogalacturonase A/B/Epimerase-like pectate lyase domain-containing protein n=1 Tax=Paenibacillus allorhizosphaerae TaxID=2849866 RepID=A0ABM8VNZ5_9BACL|nr:glycosyl hydrolase family 28-related protein [Paenibacillus allorhizosphaerae]CAG7652213.1 hypothetical protein PAECIP111802_05165 [Paenibacillus allorhizosphaerae]
MSDPLNEQKSHNDHDAPRSTISRRKLIASLGTAGVAAVAGAWLHGSAMYGAASEGPASVTKDVYGPDKPKVRELLAANVVVSVTITELRRMEQPDPGTVYYVTDERREGHFIYDDADTTSADNDGTIIAATLGARFKRLYDGGLNVKWFGAAGNGAADDTQPVRAALSAAKGRELYFPAGVYHLTDTITIPRNTFVRGAGSSSWFTFGQRRTEVTESILDMESGTVLKFAGNGSSRFSSNRADFQSFTCAVKLEADGDGIQLSDLKVLSHFRIRDEAGWITTPETDQHALFDVGLWVDNADHVKLSRISVVGYWQKAGLLVDASGRLSSSSEYGAVEYITIKDCVFQGKIGMALLGGDEGAPPDGTGFTPPTGKDDLSEGQFGLSHAFVSDSFLSGTDHHSNGFVNGWQQHLAPDSTPLKIDGFIGSGVPYRINHPRFVNCSFQTRESASIMLDRVVRPTFVNCRAESGPVRATRHTVMPRLVNCEFPYNRTNAAYQEIEHCPGAVITPPFRRLGQIHLQEYAFQIELRNNNGVIEHRVSKAFGIQSGGRSHDAEALFRFAIEGAGWNYRNWTATPMPGGTESDNYAAGLFIGDKSSSIKTNLFLSAAVDNSPDYQEAEVVVVDFRASDGQLWAKPAVYTAQKVPYRFDNYSTTLKIELRNGSGLATGLADSLPSESNGAASLILRVKGKFYEQAYGLV